MSVCTARPGAGGAGVGDAIVILSQKGSERDGESAGLSERGGRIRAILAHNPAYRGDFLLQESVKKGLVSVAFHTAT